MIIPNSRLFLVALVAITVPFGKLSARTCTFTNKTTRAEVKVRFFRASALVPDTSQIFTLFPGEKAEWGTGIYPITGIEIVEMKYFPTGKITPGGGIPVPGFEKAKERWKLKGRHVNQAWEMFEAKFPIDENRSEIQFTLMRLPAGVGGSVFPGGKVWESAKLAVTEGLKRVEIVK